MRLRKWQVHMKWHEGVEIYGPYLLRSSAAAQAYILNAPFYPNMYAFIERIKD